MAIPDGLEHDAGGVALVADRCGRARRDVVERGLEALARAGTRGACDAAARSATRAGILTAIPWDAVAPDLPPALCDPAAHRIAAMFALDAQQADRAILAARSALGRLGWYAMAWREVPMRLEALAPERRAHAPRMVQCFARAPRYRVRRTPHRTRLAIEARWLRLGLTGCSVASLSGATMVYKALVDPSALSCLYPDLADAKFNSAFAVVHDGCDAGGARWDLAQPFHAIAHAGIVRTIGGSRLWMETRIDDAGIRDEADLVKAGGSDAQTLDAAVQWLREIGLSTPHALARLLPPAWEAEDDLLPDVRAFHRHESCFAEPWAGHAAVAFADGRYAGAIVGRSGLRPMYTIQTGDLLCAASEPDVFGACDDPAMKPGRIRPGEMIVLDLADGAMLQGDAVWSAFAAEKPYAALANRVMHRLPGARSRVSSTAQNDPCPRPPSLRTLLGRRGQWTPHGLQPVLLELDTPVLTERELEALLAQNVVRAAVVPIGFTPQLACVGGQGCPSPLDIRRFHEGNACPTSPTQASPGCNPAAACAGSNGEEPGEALRAALASLQATAAALAANGARILVLTDRTLEPGHVPIPPLLATCAVDSGLRSARLRLRASIVVDSNAIHDAREAAALASRGASAFLPRGLYASALGMTGGVRAPEGCRTALEDGLREVLSAAGVCSFEAYCGSRLEAPRTSLPDALPPSPAEPAVVHA